MEGTVEAQQDQRFVCWGSLFFPERLGWGAERGGAGWGGVGLRGVGLGRGGAMAMYGTTKKGLEPNWMWCNARPKQTQSRHKFILTAHTCQQKYWLGLFCRSRFIRSLCDALGCFANGKVNASATHVDIEFARMIGNQKGHRIVSFD